MPSLKIHRQYQSGIEKIIALDSSVFEAILSALRKTVSALPIDDLVRNVESEVENTNHDDLVNILESIIAIYALKKTYAWTVEELADELIAAVDEFEYLSNLSTEEKEQFCEKLNDLLMPNSFLESASKAKDVLKVYLLPSGIPADDFPIKSKVELEAEFKKFAEQWRVETGMLSLVTQKSMHQAYQRIIGMGQPVIPLILRDLEQKPDHWFWALRAITGDNPVKPEQRGRMKQMALAWIQWEKNTVMSGKLEYRKILRFPNLELTEYQVTSAETVDYNCFAFAAGEEECRWHPVDPDGYWPDSVSRELTLEAFIKAYQTIGYEPCENRDLEPGFEKIAIYTYNGQPQHAARQEEDGKWKSKLGDWEDIEHELEGLENPNYYGVVQQILKRAIIFLNIS